MANSLYMDSFEDSNSAIKPMTESSIYIWMESSTVPPSRQISGNLQLGIVEGLQDKRCVKRL